jgi:hypothetical protein
MVAYQNRLYAVEPNHGQVISIGGPYDIYTALDVSASQGYIVPTAIAERDSDFLLGNLNLFPIEPNYARILTLSRSECSRSLNPGRQDGAVRGPSMSSLPKLASQPSLARNSARTACSTYWSCLTSLTPTRIPAMAKSFVYATTAPSKTWQQVCQSRVR